MKNKIFILILLGSSYSILGQSNKSFWTANSKNTTGIPFENKKSITAQLLFQLDFEALQQSLSNAPKRFGSIKKSNTIALFPSGDGKLEHFSIFESSNMDAALAQKYPNIKSYVGQGIENPTSTLYFSMSPLGLESMLIDGEHSAVFIEPYTTDLRTYVVYKKSDKIASLTKFECKVIADTQSDIKNNTAARPNADDGFMRTFRLALSVTGEYTVFFGGTKPLALAAMNNSMTRVNGVFEKDFGVHMNLIANNDILIYTDAATDPYSPSANKSNWNAQLQTTLTSVIGEANYDIGHLFGASGGGGNAGCIGCVCVNGSKGSGITSPADAIPQGDNFDIDYVAHEMGHQFGANHTWTHGGNEGTGVQMEPGSGSTIMGYAGITSLDVQPHSDAYFHAVSIQQVTNYIKTTTCQTNTATGNATPTANAGLDYTIPKSTPFMLTAAGTDANGDALTYNWEQMDSQTNATVPNATKTSGVNFRSYNSATTPIRYFPKMSSVLTGATTTAGSELTVEALPSVARTLNFRVTVRDNSIIGPANNSDDMIVTTNATAGPFTVTSPNTSVYYVINTNKTITWSVAGTTGNGVNCANVDILLSTDGGATFPITLAAATPNDGSQSVTIPNNLGSTNRIMIKGTNHIFFDVSNTNFTIGVPDTTNPTAPTLVASGTTFNATTLSWSGATDNIGVTDYDVYQGAVLIGNTTATTYSVTGLNPSTSYSFTVKAKDGVGNASVASNIVNITTLAPDITAPTAPTLVAYGTAGTTTNLSWSGATDNVAVTAYDVYKGGVLLGSTAATTYAVTALTALTTYTFTVKAKDAAGNNSVFSNTVSVTTIAANYCASQGNSVVDELIGNVQLGTINNTSTGGTGYTDFTAIATNLTIGASQTISITPTWTGTIYNEGYAVFIDYNRDGDFLDAGETVWTKTASTMTPVSGTFVIPSTATVGTTRMRVSLKYNGTPTACETFSFGQVEDYTVVLVAPPSNSIVNIKMFIEGYYDTATHAMLPVKANQGIGTSTTIVDDITAELRNSSTLALVASTNAILNTDGSAIATFATSLSGSYYLVIKHRNGIQTWSANPITVGSSPIAYDFTNVISKAYGSNMIEVESNVWAFISGDTNQDESIDLEDVSNTSIDNDNSAFGVLATDLNGDGSVDLIDVAILGSNSDSSIFSNHP